MTSEKYFKSLKNAFKKNIFYILKYIYFYVKKLNTTKIYFFNYRNIYF